MTAIAYDEGRSTSEIGRRLIRLRHRDRRSAHAVARAVGLTTTGLRKIELGCVAPTMFTVAALARYYGATIDRFLSGRGPFVPRPSRPAACPDHARRAAAGARLRAHRRARFANQMQFAESVGYTIPALCMVERGRYCPRPDRFADLARGLGTTMDQLWYDIMKYEDR